MAILRISNADARRLFLYKHLLSGKPADLPDLFDQLAFVQLDSINTVARAHHMIIHARLPAYRPRDLDRLMARDRRVFEHWTHDASVINMDYYPYWRLRFRRSGEGALARWMQSRRGDFQSLLGPMLERIATDGPLCSADVGEDEKKGSGGWWDWHPSKTALEYLWISGQIAVCHRENFRKYYDLADRIIPPAIFETAVPDQECIDWSCSAAIDRLGFATSGEIASFFDHVSATEARDWCMAERKAGRLIDVEIGCADGSWRKSLARPDIENQLAQAVSAPSLVRILSPFDPALRDRARAERLFGFSYRIEIFVPAAKRTYGYYVFPVLEGDRLIGRIDMKEDKGVLSVTRFWPEQGVSMGKGRIARLEAAIDRSRRLSGAERTDWAADWLAA